MNDEDTRPVVKRVKTGSFERRFSLAKAGFLAGARYATRSAGNWFGDKENRKERSQAILSDQAQFLVEELGKLKGSVVKIGQMMALYGEHFLPEEVTEALHTLEQDTTALHWEAIEQVLLEELGAERLAELEVSPEPLGAASLGQVHRAWRKADGKALCLKIQYPGVADAIDSDLNAVMQLLRLARLVPKSQEFDAWLEEVREMLHREVDYHLERATTERFRERLADDPRYVVPETLPEYCTGKVLALTYETGLGLDDRQVRELEQERRNRIVEAALELCCKEVFCWNEMQTDPNFGNYRVRLRSDEHSPDQLVLLDFGAIKQFTDEILEPGREMVRGAFYGDKQRLIKAVIELGFMEADYPKKVLDEFAEMCFLAIEPFAEQEDVQARYALTPDGAYCWGHSDLHSRVSWVATRSAMSRYFKIPPKEFMFLSRKLMGAYTFASVLDARLKARSLLAAYL